MAAAVSDDPFEQMLSEQREQLKQFEAENQQFLSGTKGKKTSTPAGVDPLDAVMFELEHQQPFTGF